MSIWLCFLQTIGPPMLNRHWIDCFKDVSLTFRDNAVQHVEIFFPERNHAFTSIATAVGRMTRHSGYYCNFNEEHSWIVFELKLKRAEIQKIYDFCENDEREFGTTGRYDYLSLLTCGIFNNTQKRKYMCASYVGTALCQSPDFCRKIARHIGQRRAEALTQLNDPHQLFTYANDCCIAKCSFLVKLNLATTYVKTTRAHDVVITTDDFFDQN